MVPQSHGKAPSAAPDLEEEIASTSVAIATAMLDIVKEAQSEEDIRHGCNSLLDAFAKRLGLDIKARHEYALAGGRVDSKYGAVILEYKYPKGTGRLAEDLSASGTQAAIKQLIQRFSDFSSAERIAPERLLGIAWDGRYLLFVRHRANDFQFEGPSAVTPYTVSRLLRALVSLGARGASFTPTALTSKFGADSNLARKAAQALYATITDTNDPKAITFLSQWQTLFSEVCGYDVAGTNPKIVTLARHYGISSARSAELLFSIHTYYALFMKVLAAEIASTTSKLGTSFIKRCVQAPTDEKLRAEMALLEEGGIWAQLGIGNFLEGDLFSWYLSAWSDPVAGFVRDVMRTFDEFDPATLSVDPTESRDLLKQLYQHLFPREVRHDLGEYYTPDWLADHVLESVDYDGDPDKRLLDPACGSGTFLVLAINRARAWFERWREECSFSETEFLQKILSNIIGFDLNPLAVMAARTNYLLAIRDLLRFVGPIEIPVYLCDSVTTPAEHGDLFTGARLGWNRRISTAAGEFVVPKEIATNRETLARYASSLEHSIRHKETSGEFWARCESENLALGERDVHLRLHAQLMELDAAGRNGIWARIIKNQFAPIFVGKVDLVVGNPPWINWEDLPPEYRTASKTLWNHYELMGAPPLRKRQRSEKVKTDISVLMTYVAADVYLRPNGKLGFVITRSLFQSEIGGWHFRKFALPSGESIAPMVVNDFDDLKPFRSNAANSAATMILKKSHEKITFPINYVRWERRPKQTIEEDDEWQHVQDKTRHCQWAAFPVQKALPQSAWIVGSRDAIDAVRSVIAPSPYSRVAREGINTRGANGVFFVDVEQARGDKVLIRNRADDGDSDVHVPQVECFIEQQSLSPLLRGRDVARWIATPRSCIVLPHDKAHTARPIPFSQLPRLTRDYLARFKTKLASRKKFRNFDPGSDEWYALYSVLDATYSKYKVVWKEMAAGSIAAVVSGAPVCERGARRTVVPDHKLMLVPVGSLDEANYVAGVLNSAPARYIVRSFALSTGVSTHILDKLPIQRFKQGDSRHVAIVRLAADCAAAAGEGREEDLARLEQDLDEVVAKAWGLTTSQLGAIAAALRLLEGGRASAED